MLTKAAVLLLSAAALGAAQWGRGRPAGPDANLPDGGSVTEFIRRCPLNNMGGLRRISTDHRLFADCNWWDDEAEGTSFERVRRRVVELDLGRCFANDNGEVVFRKNGNLQQTCSTCAIVRDTSRMQCICPNGNDEWIESEIELNEVLEVNKDGCVCCKGMGVCGKEVNPDEWHAPSGT